MLKLFESFKVGSHCGGSLNKARPVKNSHNKFFLLFVGCLFLSYGSLAQNVFAAEKQSYRLSIIQGFNFQKDNQDLVGHITELKIGSTKYEADLKVQDPTKVDSRSKVDVVGVMSAIRWSGDASEPVTFTAHVGFENAKTAAVQIHKELTDTSVELKFVIYKFDPEKREYYPHFYAGDAALKGLIEKYGGELEFEMDLEEQCREVPSPINFELYLSVMPQQALEAQVMHITGPNRAELTGAWGGAPAPQAGGGLYALYQGAAIDEDSDNSSAETGTFFPGAYPESEEVTHTFNLDNFAAERTVSISISDYGDVPEGVENLTADNTVSRMVEDDYRRASKADFSVSPATLTIPEGTYGAPGQATFDVSFKPGGKGLRQAMVTVEQDGEEEISFLIQGGTASPIQLRGGYGYYVIGDRDNTPEETDSTDFLTRKINDDPATHTFALYNSEMRDITVLTELRDATTGFSLSEQSVVVPAATDDGAGRATFDVTFDPATTGAHDTFVDLSYDGERQLSFKVSGEGENGGGGAVSPLGLALLGLILVGLGYRRSRLVK